MEALLQPVKAQMKCDNESVPALFKETEIHHNLEILICTLNYSEFIDSDHVDEEISIQRVKQSNKSYGLGDMLKIVGVSVFVFYLINNNSLLFSK